MPKLPPEAPSLSDTPAAFTRLCHGVLYSLSDPSNPVVL